MFIGFFYLLRSRGFGVTLSEWMTLLEGLLLDLHHTTLTGFYDLCRAVLVKTEAVAAAAFSPPAISHSPASRR